MVADGVLVEDVMAFLSNPLVMNVVQDQAVLEEAHLHMDHTDHRHTGHLVLIHMVLHAG